MALMLRGAWTGAITGTTAGDRSGPSAHTTRVQRGRRRPVDVNNDGRPDMCTGAEGGRRRCPRSQAFDGEPIAAFYAETAVPASAHDYDCDGRIDDQAYSRAGGSAELDTNFDGWSTLLWCRARSSKGRALAPRSRAGRPGAYADGVLTEGSTETTTAWREVDTYRKGSCSRHTSDNDNDAALRTERPKRAAIPDEQ